MRCGSGLQSIFKRGTVNFVFNGTPVCLVIRHVLVYPQAYAAVVPQAARLKEIPRTFIIDIGGFTTDVMLLRNSVPDMQFCRSLEMGVDSYVQRYYRQGECYV